MSDPQWDSYAEQKKETMLDDIGIAISKVHIEKGHLELKSVMDYVNANFGDWERFITKEDISEVFKEYVEKKSKV
jgi:hypothetical protein|tara:strand:- start:197 stop:421 length:225 start_codon:yes stop_codon:yes gene_type:complete